MGSRYDQIFNLKSKRAVKLENSSYLEDLTGLLARAASLLDNEECYCFGNDFYLKEIQNEPNSSYEQFIKNLQNSFKNSCGSKICIIRGKAGIGKTLFFEKGIQKLINDRNCESKYISMGVDFKNIDNDKDVGFYENYIYQHLRKSSIDNIRLMGKDIFQKFKEDYKDFGIEYETDHTFLFPLKFFCNEIFRKYGKPCIIIFDNIDLASVYTQTNVFKATANISTTFNKFMKISNAEEHYRMYFAMRPETLMHSEEAKIGEVINFPLPNLLKIFLAIIKNCLLKAAKELDEESKLKCDVTCSNVLKDDGTTITLNSYKSIANYFFDILRHFLNDIWNDNNNFICERLGKSEDFHCGIVNYNVRTFLNFMADTISNGGFKPFTKEFNETVNSGHYNVFNYIEMIIKGRWQIHPGNDYIDGEGGNKAPIIFNIFDTSLYSDNQADKVKHFLLNLRLLQYFYFHSDGREISYIDLKESLKILFSEEHIKRAVQKLIHVRMIYSFIEGDSAIAAIKDWRDVKIQDNIKLKLSDSGKFYFEKLISEFEYLYQMALSSLMYKKYVDILKSCWKTEKEKTVLYFLKSIFEILKENIEGYKQNNTIESLVNLFYRNDMNNYSGPFERMLKSFILVMQNKVQYAQRVETGNTEKLENILTEAEELLNMVQQYFIEVLGGK